MQSVRAGYFLVSLLSITYVSSLKDGPSSSVRDHELDQDEQILKENHPLNMKMGASQAKKADVTTTYEALVKEAKQTIEKSKRVCGGKNAEHHSRRLLQSSPDSSAASLLLSDSYRDKNKQLLGTVFRVREQTPREGKCPDKLKWVVLTDDDFRDSRMDFLFAAGDRTFDIHKLTYHAITIRLENVFKTGVYRENVFRPGSSDFVMNGTVLESSNNGSKVSVCFGDSFLRLDLGKNSGCGPLESCQRLYFLFQKL